MILARRIRHTPGNVPAGPRVGIYTIYPVAGLQHSHLDTLKALLGAGFSPIVVSNLPLSEAARADLVAQSTTVIERPNFGYDFGAYREGLRSLRRQGREVSDLVLLNDSVWYPVGAGDWLCAATRSKCNFVGAVSNCGIRLSPGRDGAPPSWEYDPGLDNFHYCSFALRFDATILGDSGFWAFWRRFRLTDDKFATIRRGEVGLSRWILSRGYSHDSTFPVSDLGRIVDAKDLAALFRIAEGLVIPEDAALRARQRALLDRLSDGPEPPPQKEAAACLRAFILEVIAETGPAYALPAFAIQELWFPFLKKSPIWLDKEGRRITLDILTRFCPEDYAAEAHALLEARGA